MSLRSFSFLKPAKAMVVPGMYLVERAHEQKTHISEICTHNAYNNCGAYLLGIHEVLK